MSSFLDSMCGVLGKLPDWGKNLAIKTVVAPAINHQLDPNLMVKSLTLNTARDGSKTIHVVLTLLGEPEDVTVEITGARLLEKKGQVFLQIADLTTPTASKAWLPPLLKQFAVFPLTLPVPHEHSAGLKLVFG